MIWLFKIAVDLAGSLAAMLLAPFVVLLADKYTGRLPQAFWWMETPDNRLPGDLREPTVAWLYNRVGFYLTSVYWLGWRNKSYGLSTVLAYRPKPDDALRWWGNRDVSDDNSKRGCAFFRIGRAWELYAVYGKKFGVRIRLGYKLQPFFQNPKEAWTNPLWGMPVIHFSLRKLGG